MEDQDQTEALMQLFKMLKQGSADRIGKLGAKPAGLMAISVEKKKAADEAPDDASDPDMVSADVTKKPMGKAPKSGSSLADHMDIKAMLAGKGMGKDLEGSDAEEAAESPDEEAAEVDDENVPSGKASILGKEAKADDEADSAGIASGSDDETADDKKAGLSKLMAALRK